jgi:signal transduction histidine kinase
MNMMCIDVDELVLFSLILYILLRTIGLAISLDYYIQNKKDVYMYFSIGWLISLIGGLFPIFGQIVLHDLFIFLNGLLVSMGTLLLLLGSLATFLNVSRRRVLLLILIMNATFFTIVVSMGYRVATNIAFPTISGIILVFIIIPLIKFKDFKKKVGVGAKWYVVVAALTFIYIPITIMSSALGYSYGLYDVDDPVAILSTYIPLIASMMVIIIYLVNLEYSFSRLEQQRVQIVLKNQTANLEHVVEERTKLLKETQEKVMQQEKFAAIGKLAGNVAHELRNPLGIITNSVHFLGLKLPETDEKIQKHLKLILEQSVNANQIIMDLLDFAKTKPTEARMVDIKSLIEETVDQIPRADTIKIKTSIDTDLPTILLDPGKMKQAFQNIIVNAIQAMLDGGILTITASKKGDMIEIAFKDTGVGISRENRPRLFEPLFSTKVKGIGLGLVIVKEIVEYHEGKVTVESEVGVGSTFTIELPIREKKIAFTKLSTSFW